MAGEVQKVDSSPTEPTQTQADPAPKSEYDFSDLNQPTPPATTTKTPEPVATPTPTTTATPPSSQPETPPAAEPPAKPAHPRSLVRRALEHGATLEQINSMSLQELDETVDWYDVQKARDLEAKKQQAAAEPEPGLDLVLDPEQEQIMHPSITKILKTVPELVKKTRELEAENKKHREDAVKRESRSNFEKFEAGFDALPENYRRWLGSSGDDIAESEKALRAAVFSKSGLDFHSPPPPSVLKKKLQDAADVVLGKMLKMIPPAPAPTNGNGTHGKRFTDEQFAASAVAKPTNREAKKDEKGDAAAREKAREWRQSHGLPVDEGVADKDEVLGGLPD